MTNDYLNSEPEKKVIDTLSPHNHGSGKWLNWKGNDPIGGIHFLLP